MGPGAPMSIKYSVQYKMKLPPEFINTKLTPVATLPLPHLDSAGCHPAAQLLELPRAVHDARLVPGPGRPGLGAGPAGPDVHGAHAHAIQKRQELSKTWLVPALLVPARRGVAAAQPQRRGDLQRESYRVGPKVGPPSGRS